MSKIKICRKCGYQGKPKIITSGSLFIELILWMTIIFGLLYTAWRKNNQYEVCRHCGARDALLPIDSPLGKKLLAELEE